LLLLAGHYREQLARASRGGASRSCLVRPPASDAAWPPVAVLRSHIAPRQRRLRRLGLVLCRKLWYGCGQL